MASAPAPCTCGCLATGAHPAGTCSGRSAAQYQASGPKPEVGAGERGRGLGGLPPLGRGRAAWEPWDDMKVSRLLRKWGGGGGEGLREEGRGADGSLFGVLEWLFATDMVGQAN